MKDATQPRSLDERFSSPSSSDWAELGMTAYFAAKQSAIEALGPRLGWYALAPVGWGITLSFEIDDIATSNTYREMTVQPVGAVGAIVGANEGFAIGGAIGSILGPLGTVGGAIGELQSAPISANPSRSSRPM